VRLLGPDRGNTTVGGLNCPHFFVSFEPEDLELELDNRGSMAVRSLPSLCKALSIQQVVNLHAPLEELTVDEVRGGDSVVGARCWNNIQE
jgi:hypothetical protein